jgi:hypothetical protein
MLISRIHRNARYSRNLVRRYKEYSLLIRWLLTKYYGSTVSVKVTHSNLRKWSQRARELPIYLHLTYRFLAFTYHLLRRHRCYLRLASTWSEVTCGGYDGALHLYLNLRTFHLDWLTIEQQNLWDSTWLLSCSLAGVDTAALWRKVVRWTFIPYTIC